MMTTNLKVFYSNRIEQLYCRLKEECLQGAPFTKRLVVVPNPAIKSWLMLQFAQDPSVRIAAGLEFLYLPQLIDRLTKRRDASKIVPSQTELRLAIEAEIKKVIRLYDQRSTREQHCWEPLMAHLKVAKGRPFSKRGERRLIALSEKLALLFTKYGTYGSSLVREWEETSSPSGWQQLLWKNLFGATTPWSYPTQQLNTSSLACQENYQLFFFAISFLSPAHHAFFVKTAHQLPIHYFLLSPCSTFWSDISSDRDRQRMLRHWRNAGISREKQGELEEYLRECNPLLANYGKLGRQMAAQIEDSFAETVEDYQEAEPNTLLTAVQADMLHLRNAQEEPKTTFPLSENSIQLHVASSPRREVEILYNNLIGLIDRHSTSTDPITPKDILVMAPDIMAYHPYIKAVFDDRSSQLDYQLMDLQMAAQSSLVQGFLFLLNLPASRWDVSTILQLFSFPEFRRRHQLSGEDLQQLISWMKEAGIRWGENACHRNEMLERDHCARGMIEESDLGTWDQGIARLIEGMVLAADTQGVSRIIALDTTKNDLLGKLIQLLRSLREDLKPLEKNQELSLADWVSYLRCLCEAYFSPNSSSSEAFRSIDNHLSSLKYSAKRLGDATYSFISVKQHLESLLSQETGCVREHHLQAVRFCSMLPMRAIPAKVICLLGMEEGAFPKVDVLSALNLMQNDARSDYCPSSVDYDRFLFLEVLLSARQTILLSYSASNRKETLPSLLVTELMNYLDSGYTLEGTLPSKQLTFFHPFHPFDKLYFSGDPHFNSYLPNHYAAAKAYYGETKNRPSSFIPELFSGAIVHSEESTLPDQIDVKSLLDFSRNPLKAYYNQVLAIYIGKDRRHQLQNQENFLLSHQDHGKLRKSALKTPVEQLFSFAESEGILPLGPFKSLGMERIEETAQEIQRHLAEQGISPDQIFDIELDPHCTTPCQKEEALWHYPAPQVNYRNTPLKVVGRLSDVTHHGLIFHGKKEAKELIKIWPKILLMLHLFPEGKVIPTREKESIPRFIQEPSAALERYLDHYFASQKTASFLLPEWIPELLSKKGNLQQELRNSLLNDRFHPNYNETLLWTLSPSHLPESWPHLETLCEQAAELFSDINVLKKRKEDPA